MAITSSNVAAWSTTVPSDAFKRKYAKPCENTYNTSNPTTSKIKKLNDLEGEGIYLMVPLSFGGSVNTGSTLPTATVADYDQAVITSKSHYGRARIAREAIMKSKSDVGSFVRGLKEVVKKTVESYVRNDARMFFGNGDGSLGTISGSPTGSDPYVLTFAAGYTLANFEEGDRVNIETGNTDPFLITLVDPQTDGTLDVTVDRLSGSQVPADTDEVFMVNSEDNDVNGLKQVCDATSGNLYSIPVARRWQSTQLSASSNTLSTEYMNQVMLDIEEKTGRTPNHIVTSYTQFEKLLNLLEDHKRYPIDGGGKASKGSLSFRGIEFMSTAGPVAVVADRFCDPDRMYFLNTKYISRHHAPGGVQWFDEDGTIFLREADSDSYEARYGGYYQNFIIPTFQGVLTSLAT